MTMWNPFAKHHAEPPSKDQEPSDNATSHSDQNVNPISGKFIKDRKFHSEFAEIEMMNSVAVATLTETELTQDEGVEKLAALLLDMKETGAHHFVLDIQNIQYMDSMCLGCLVESLNSMASHGGRIALVNTTHSVQSMFRMTRLDRVFSICHDVMQAIEEVERKSA